MKNEISNVLNLIESGDTYKALQNAKSFYGKNKNNIDAIKLLAYSNIQIGNFEKVIEVLEDGYGKREELRDFDFYNNMGYALSQIEELDESISYLKKALKVKDDPSTKSSLAEIFLKKENLRKLGRLYWKH